MNEDNKSNALPSMKKEIIMSFMNTASLGKLELPGGASADFSENQIIIVTPGCVINGLPQDTDVVSDVDVEGNTFAMALTNLTVKTAAKHYREKYNIEGPLNGSDGCIILKDVTIQYSANFTVNTPELAVFIDQILAITVGKKN